MRLHGALLPWEIALLPRKTRKTAFSNATDVSRGKFSVLNIHGYVKKITRSAHDIYRGKLQWYFGANHYALFDRNT